MSGSDGGGGGASMLVYRFLVDETKPKSVGNTFVLCLTQIMDTKNHFLKEMTRFGWTDCCFVNSQERGMSAAMG